MASEYELRLIIKAIDQASSTLKAVKSGTDSMGEGFADAAEEAKPLGLALTAVGVAGTALIATATMTAARVEVLGTVLGVVGGNAGYTESQLASFEEGVKALGITTGASREGLIRLAQAEIDLSYATDLARMAQDAAVIANINSSEAYERLVTVVQRGSPVMARTLGLNVDFQASYERMADQLGKNTDELTANEKMQARLNEVLAQGAGIAGSYEAAMGDVGKRLTSLPRLYEEAGVALGEGYLPLLGDLVTVQEDVLKGFIDLEPAQQTVIARFLGIGTAAAAAGGGLILAVPKITAMVEGLGALNVAAAGAGIALGPIGLAAAALAALYVFADIPDELGETITYLDLLQGSSRDLGSGFTAAADGGIVLEDALSRVDEAASDLADGWNSQYSPALLNARGLTDGWAGSLLTASGAADDVTRAIDMASMTIDKASEASGRFDAHLKALTRDIHISVYWDHYGSPDAPGGRGGGGGPQEDRGDDGTPSPRVPSPTPPPDRGGPAQYQHGTDYVPRTGWAWIHRGEAVIPAGQNAGGRSPVIVNQFFGRDAVRSDQDLVDIAGATRDAQHIRGAPVIL